MTKKSRYGNIRRQTHADGTVLDSKRELNRYNDLTLLQKAKQITELEVHPRYPIQFEGRQTIGDNDPIIKIKYASGRQLTYVADFRYVRNGRTVIEDVKMESGHRTATYKIKRALMNAMGHNIEEY